MSALQTIYRKRLETTNRILEPSAQKLVPVKEATIYPAQFPVLLRERLQGKSVAEVAEYLGGPPKDVNRLLAGHWRPTKGICQKMGLKVVYAMTEPPGGESPAVGHIEFSTALGRLLICGTLWICRGV